jgi:flagellar biosynthesis GTPase FlhF
MFGRLFGKKKKKIDPEEQKRLDKLKKQKAQVESKEKLEKNIAKNEKQIADLEAKVSQQYKEALVAKKAGQKEKAMRLLTNIKNNKARIKKFTGYNTMMYKRINDMESMNTDIQMADIFKDTVRLFRDLLKMKQEELMNRIKSCRISRKSWMKS